MLIQLTKDRLFLFSFVVALFYWAGYSFLINPLSEFQAQVVIRDVLFLVFLIPVIEELCFRGLMQEFFWSKSFAQKKFLGISIANILTSLAFVLLHLYYHVWYFAFLVFFPSLVFGFFRDRYQSVIPGVILHIWYNSGAYWFPL